MANKIVKIVYDENTWIDMTGDTAVPANVLINKTFHTSTGQETGSMPNGTAGTPVATKGTVSNNSIAVIPSVTNTTGYITGGTKTGTAVTVTASELVSGTKSIMSSGTTDVTNYANASVAAGTEGTPVASKGIATNNSIQVIPTVTNSMGFIQGGVTKMGLPVTVSASELVSGTKTISANGTTDVTNYASVDVPAGSASGPNLIISSDASITATDNNQIGLTGTANVQPTVNAGWVSSGTATTATVFVIASVPTKAATTYTPTTTNQTIASGTYLTGAQTIKGDANLIPANIASGVTIFNVAGSHVGGTDVSDTTATASDVLTGKYFYTAAGVKTQGTITSYTGSHHSGT